MTATAVILPPEIWAMIWKHSRQMLNRDYSRWCLEQKTTEWARVHQELCLTVQPYQRGYDSPLSKDACYEYQLWTRWDTLYASSWDLKRENDLFLFWVAHDHPNGFACCDKYGKKLRCSYIKKNK